MTQLLRILVLLAVTHLAAHDTWLQPERFLVTPGATLELGLTSADGFSGAETAISPERVAALRVRLAGESLDLPAPTAGEKTLRIVATLPRPGVAVFGVSLKSRHLELAPDKIELYLREIHADDALRALWEAVPEPRKWRESYAKHAKTFVRVGEPPAGEREWERPLGLKLEIVPERDPTALRAGDEMPVRVLKDGVPFAGFTLAFVSVGEAREHVVVTDESGRASAKLDLPGAWLLHGTDLRRVQRGDLEWESDFTTMVVEAR